MNTRALLPFLCVLIAVPSLADDAHWATSHIHGSPEPPKPYIAEQVFTKLTLGNVLDMVPAPALNQWMLVSNDGKIWSVPNDLNADHSDLALDLKAMHSEVDHAYGIAFHPKFSENKQVFITYTNGDKKDDGSRLSRFKVKQDNPLIIDPGSEEIILTWLSGGHNGAAMVFGNDGLLYLSTGDGEVPAPPDPRKTGQDISDLLSSVLRIDIDHKDAGKNYAVPQDNPFIHTPAARPEIWTFGHRNPWKLSIDRRTDTIWCGDVGWEQWEQIFIIKRGANYGWSAMEGNNPVLPERKHATVAITPPTVTHHHSEAASITGGFVYHGKRLPELEGAYLYGDYETGKIWALWHDGKQITRHEEIASTPLKIVTFGQGEDGDVFFVHYGNPTSVHRLIRNPSTSQPSAFPRKLSATGLFADVIKQTPASGVHAFDIAAPMWADGAQGTRFVAIPEGKLDTKVRTNKKGQPEGKVKWPAETVLAKTLTMQLDQSKPESAIKIETQVLHYDGTAWNAYSYRWNEAGTDAELVSSNGDERALDLVGDRFPGGRHRYDYRFHSRAECIRCHNNWSGFALGFQPQQLKDESKWTTLELVDANFFKQSNARLVNPHNEAGNRDLRARSWLHANCAHCHRENGGGSVAVLLNAELALNELHAVDEKPLRGEFGLGDARVIANGDPWRSVLLHRMATTGSGHMPAIGSHEIDLQSAELLAEWINGFRADHVMRLISSDPFHRPESALCIALFPSKHDPDDVLALARSQRPASARQTPLRISAHSLGDVQEPAPLTWDTSIPVAPSVAAHIHGLLDRLLPDSERIKTLGTTASAAKILAVKGDAKRGAELLTPINKGIACLACHFVNGSGHDFGPDLSKVGARLTKDQLIESLLTPSKVIAQGFAPVVVTLKDNSAQTGFVLKREGDVISLKIATGQTLPLNKAQVQSEQTLPGSLMPEGLLQGFTAQEAADMVEYLGSLK